MMRSSQIQVLLVLLATLCSALLPSPAGAHETDPITGRGLPLEDAAPVADAYMDRLLAAAIEETNTRTRCKASPEQARRVLARAIHRRTGGAEPVRGRGLRWRAGHSRYSAWLEMDPLVDRLSFEQREDVYGELRPWQSPVLSLFGPASTIQLAGVRLGTDKINHFFNEGWEYWKKSEGGARLDRALRWGVFTERTYYGLMTSNAFSFADLRANYDGYLFYSGLLRPGSIVALDDGGCVVQVEPWKWDRWVDEEYDELLNPPLFGRGVARRVQAVLEERQAEVCAERARWARSGSLERFEWEPEANLLPHYVRGPVPVREEAFDLDALCGPLTGPGSEGQGGVADARTDEDE